MFMNYELTLHVSICGFILSNANSDNSKHKLVSCLLHLLSEGGEHLVALGQRGLELFELVHVQRQLGKQDSPRSTAITKKKKLLPRKISLFFTLNKKTRVARQVTCCLSCVSCSFISSHLCLDSVASFRSCDGTTRGSVTYILTEVHKL